MPRTGELGRSRQRLVVLLALLHVLPFVLADMSGSQDHRDFQSATPGYRYQFPADHGAHEQFRTEWWYYTGHLRSPAGEEFGYELTFFRRAIEHQGAQRNPSRWAVRQLYLAHFALTDLGTRQFRYAEKVSRAGIGKAGAARDRLRVWIDRWSAEGEDDGEQHLKAAAADFSLDLHLRPLKPPVIHGEDGVSRKGSDPGQTSHYYSIPRLRTEGTLRVGDRALSVRGQTWMDHEFGSGELAPELSGWDWFSVQLEDGRDLMLYQLRERGGGVHPASSGTMVSVSGHGEHLERSDFSVEVLDTWASPRSGARYPSRWRLRLPKGGLDLVVTPRLADQELVTDRSTRVTYWEGAVRIEGTEQGLPRHGAGYVELTGYATTDMAPARQSRRQIPRLTGSGTTWGTAPRSASSR